MAKATTTIKQVLNYQADHAACFAANQVLFNRVAAFQDVSLGMAEHISDIPHQLRLQLTGSYATSAQETDYVGVSEAAERKPLRSVTKMSHRTVVK